MLAAVRGVEVSESSTGHQHYEDDHGHGYTNISKGPSSPQDKAAPSNQLLAVVVDFSGHSRIPSR